MTNATRFILTATNAQGCEINTHGKTKTQALNRFKNVWDTSGFKILIEDTLSNACWFIKTTYR